MRKRKWLGVLTFVGFWAMLSMARAQQRPYIGFVYPAGGQQGTTVQLRLGGQGLDGVNEVLVSGDGVVSARVVEYLRPLNPQEMQLLGEQLRELRRGSKKSSGKKDSMESEGMEAMSMMEASSSSGSAAAVTGADAQKIIAKIQRRMDEYVQRPASAAIAAIVLAEVVIDKNATPGERELRVVTPRGISNPLPFYIGQLPESSRAPMLISRFQILGKEELALRKRALIDVEKRVTIPCTLNGQIASGEVNRYRFTAKKGQKLVVSTLARQLVPYIADAVPGWFQPVLVLYDGQGKEVAYNDDFRFKPDPVIGYEVPKDGEYVLAIYDSIYRGREDFVYRISIGEIPFVTSIFPLGMRAGDPAPEIAMRGVNLPGTVIPPPSGDTPPGICYLTTRKGALLSNRVPFAVDTLPEAMDRDDNHSTTNAQPVTLPVIINGRVDKPDDWDVFRFQGKAGDSVVAEVYARRLDSPLDSVLKLTSEDGKILAFNDDCEDLGSGLNTHHADSYITAKLPADGVYFVHMGETSRKGGGEYVYRLRIGPPRPDFQLRAVPSSLSIPSRSVVTNENPRVVKTNATTYTSHMVHVIRLDGFTGPIKLELKDPPKGITAMPATLSGTQTMTRITLKCDLVAVREDITLTIEGRAMVDGKEVVRTAVPAEDRMQAFLWRHLVPAQELKALVYCREDPNGGRRFGKRGKSGKK